MMNKFSFIIILIVVFAAIISLILLWRHNLKINFKISTTIQVITLMAAIISATFVVNGYLHTNMAFRMSQKPSLLLGVYPSGRIFYQNRSNNPFYDLKIKIILKTNDFEYNLGEKLIQKPLYMAAHDERIAPDIQHMLKKYYGVDLNQLIKNGEVKVSLGYKFTFENKMEKIDVQSYVWREKIGWDIE